MSEIPKFEDLTPKQRASITNGCGGKGGWIRPPFGAFFETCCDHHDYGYWKGCFEKDRLNCDKKLRESMKRDCKRIPLPMRLLYYPWCWAYYRGVRICGKKYFYYGLRKRNPNICLT